jgi:B12-binding domain/radical SAM domain protein of rhizo-twelve system
MEFSRGCPYSCTFCAKENFRNLYRKRPLETVLEELDSLVQQRIEYIYFIDEIFLPDRALLEALVDRKIIFGIQTRIDLWKKDMLELLGKAGCVSIEAGIESISEEGRGDLAKNCKLSTSELSERLIFAKSQIPFVQANLLEREMDNPQEIEEWRKHLQRYGVWANEPVPLFPYPGSPEYTRRWGLPDDLAWERASHHYLHTFKHFSDIQEQRPLELEELETTLK